MVCPECGTQNCYVYVGMHNIECTNIECRHFNDAAYDRWAAVLDDNKEQLEKVYKEYLDYCSNENNSD